MNATDLETYTTTINALEACNAMDYGRMTQWHTNYADNAQADDAAMCEAAIDAIIDGLYDSADKEEDADVAKAIRETARELIGERETKIAKMEQVMLMYRWGMALLTMLCGEQFADAVAESNAMEV